MFYPFDQSLIGIEKPFKKRVDQYVVNRLRYGFGGDIALNNKTVFYSPRYIIFDYFQKTLYFK